MQTPATQDTQVYYQQLLKIKFSSAALISHSSRGSAANTPPTPHAPAGPPQASSSSWRHHRSMPALTRHHSKRRTTNYANCLQLDAHHPQLGRVHRRFTV